MYVTTQARAADGCVRTYRALVSIKKRKALQCRA